MIKVYMLDVGGVIEEERDIALTERLRTRFEGLSQQRQEKIGGLRFEKDRLLSLGAGILLDRGLSEYGLSEREAVMVCGERGKPRLQDHPDIHFNLSHSGTIAMAVFADREAGCDVEAVKEANMRVSERYFCPEERRFIEAGVTKAEQNQRFFRIWTLKESVMKVTGEGARMALDSFCIHMGEKVTEGCPHVNAPARAGTVPSVPIKEQPGTVPCVTVGGVRQPYALREFSIPDYRAAICLADGDGRGAGDVFFSFQNLPDVV